MTGPALGASDAALDLLHRLGHTVAPHVAMRLTTALEADAAAIAEVAAGLTTAQRAGLSALPDPLPLTAAVRDVFRPLDDALDDAARRVLLTAAVSVDHRVDIVLAATGLTMGDVLSGPAASHLVVAGGRLRFADARVRVHVHGSATLGERTAAHAELARAYRVAGEAPLTVWHTSLSTLEGDQTIVGPLLALAAAALTSGAAEWAHAVAREAASHATGPDRDRAHVVAGEAALSAGLVDDAATWLRAAIAGSDAVAARALPAFVHAVTLRDGNVPVGELARLAARAERGELGPAETATVGRALADAACLNAERGERADAAALLARAERIVAPRRRGRARLANARAWCALFDDALACAEPGIVDGPGADDNAMRERIVAALDLAAHGRYAHALGVLHGSAGCALDPCAPSFRDLAHDLPGPLAEAHRRVAIALVEFWAGDLARARSELAAAAVHAPIALPFAGLGVTLARRLDACTDGRTLPTSRALGDAHPTPHTPSLRSGALVDRAIAAFLGGRPAEAATLVELSAQLGGEDGSPGLAVPGLDDTQMRSDAARRAHEGGAVSRYCVPARSPYARALSELTRGRALRAQGDLGRAREHVIAASGLFHAAGAIVWQRACDDEIADLPAETLLSPDPQATTTAVPTTQPVGTGLGVGSVVDGDAVDPLAQACRAAWADVLTDREQEVALLVAEGATNRQVAERLYVSVRTVEVHLGRIFTKLAVPSRVALSVLAHRVARERAVVVP
ncbi:helix-turn-helix domain-containing protein [Microbacterium hominis]|uniref:Helix-turn-helix transcriptional regulator n=1 Tax=Microbacterium hominis TaxID=162426 RepID=A0A7D4PN14_9MICO|nr:helix-turn-helix transcriptional regulator [Microbacterium hominis]QKJ19930.1 helix-turn-helix transcriptional regulator [Microbacterium hominis]